MSEMAKNLPRESCGKRLVHLYVLYNAWSVTGKRYGIAMEQWMITGSKKMERRLCRCASWPFCRNATADGEIGKRNDGFWAGFRIASWPQPKLSRWSTSTLHRSGVAANPKPPATFSSRIGYDLLTFVCSRVRHKTSCSSTPCRWTCR
jgi:hypothetical protein